MGLGTLNMRKIRIVVHRCGKIFFSSFFIGPNIFACPGGITVINVSIRTDRPDQKV